MEFAKNDEFRMHASLRVNINYKIEVIRKLRVIIGHDGTRQMVAKIQREPVEAGN
jgi:hypothetical protein